MTFVLILDPTLISAGSTSTAKIVFSDLVNSYLHGDNLSYEKIFIDKNLLPASYPDWIHPADYSQSMFMSLKAAICRPGLGIISDLLSFGIIPTPLFEEGNDEMSHNAEVLNRLTSLFGSSQIPLLF